MKFLFTLIFFSNFLFSLSSYLFAFEATTKYQNSGNIESIISKKCCLGWREWVELPDLVSDSIQAKIDTGAKTSTLHAEEIVLFEKENSEWVRFKIFPHRDSKTDSELVETKVLETRNIRSSTGKLTIRPVIQTTLKVGNDSWPIELSLIDRSVMGYRMLIGRDAIGSKYLVDSGKSFQLLLKKKKKSKKEPTEPKVKENTESPKTNAYIDFFSSDQSGTLLKIIQSLVGIVFLYLFKILFMGYFLRHAKGDEDLQNVIQAYGRNILYLLVFTMMVIIWSAEFKNATVFLMAISVAFVIMFKELILCLLGGIYITSSRPFKFNDLIEIKKTKGYVQDIGFLSTSLADIGYQGSGYWKNGGITSVPNSIFWEGPILNFTQKSPFAVLQINLPLRATSNIKQISEHLLNFGSQLQSGYQERMEKFSSEEKSFKAQLEKHTNPQIQMITTGHDRIELIFCILAPIVEFGNIESKIKTEFIEKFCSTKN